jgi:hypothetical protein
MEVQFRVKKNTMVFNAICTQNAGVTKYVAKKKIKTTMMTMIIAAAIAVTINSVKYDSELNNYWLLFIIAS